MENRFEALNSGEVLSVDDSIVFLTGHGTFKIAEFTKLLKEKMLGSGDITEDKLGWLTEEGIKCEALRFGSTGWQKGKVRLHLEFCPDESADSSLSQKKTEVVVKLPQPKIEVTEAVEPELNLIEESEDFTASVMEEEGVFGEAVAEEISLDDSFSAIEMEETPLDLGEEFEVGEVFAEAEEEESAAMGDIFGEEEESFEDIGQSIDNELDKFEAGEEAFDFGGSEEEAISLEGFGDEETEASLDFEGLSNEEESISLEGFDTEEESISLEGFDTEEESFGLEGLGEEETGEAFDFGGLGNEEESLGFEGFDDEFSLGDDTESNPFEDSDDNSVDNLFGDDDIDDVWKDMQDLS